MDNTQGSPKGALLTTRIIWAALIMGQVVFLIVVLVMRQSRSTPPTPPGVPLGYVAIAMALSSVPMAYILRKVTQGPPDDQGHIPPPKFFTGNLFFLAMLEGVSFFGLVVFQLGDPIGLVASGLLMLVQIVNFPTGSAMAPQ